MNQAKLKSAINTIRLIEEMITEQRKKVREEQEKLRAFKTSLTKWKMERHKLIEEGCQT